MRSATIAVLVVVGVLAAGSFAAGLRREWQEASSANLSTFAHSETPTPAPLAPADRGPPIRFGLDAPSIGLAQRHEVKPDYGTVWVGAWTLQWGWQDVDLVLDGLRAQNVTPAVQLYYWGDDIHHDCFTVGCNGKTMQGWNDLAAGLATHLRDRAPGPAIVILESEFNKHQVKDDEDLDGYLAEKATTVKGIDPDATVVLGLGNWYPLAWPTWDRAAAASDAIGLQAIAGSTQDSDDRAMGLFDATLEGARIAQDLFGKPIVVTDVAVSSYPEPDHLQTQEAALRTMADGLDDLQQVGVEAVLYRSFVDTPTIPLTEHYGEAERHWGLAWHDSGELKPAGEAWVAAMKANAVVG